MADNVLHQGVSGVTDLMIKPGMINLDFADIRSVMTKWAKPPMGRRSIRRRPRHGTAGSHSQPAAGQNNPERRTGFADQCHGRV